MSVKYKLVLNGRRSVMENMQLVILLMTQYPERLFTPIFMVCGPFLVAGAWVRSLAGPYGFGALNYAYLRFPMGLPAEYPWDWVAFMLESGSLLCMLALLGTFLRELADDQPPSRLLAPHSLKAIWRLLPVLLAYLLLALAAGWGLVATFNVDVWIGFALLFVFFVALLPHFLVFIVTVMERKGVIGSFKRAWQLNQGHWWSGFRLYLLAGLMAYMIHQVASLPGLGVTFVVTINLIDPELQERLLGVLNLLTASLENLGHLVSFPVIVLAVGTQYFNLLEIKEFVGLHKKIDQIGIRSEHDDDEDY